jgi:hypothetical protein
VKLTFGFLFLPEKSLTEAVQPCIRLKRVNDKGEEREEQNLEAHFLKETSLTPLISPSGQVHIPHSSVGPSDK